MPEIALLHTSPVHVATFEALRDQIAPELILTQIVREDLLENARTQGITQTLIDDVCTTIHSTHAPVICTCTTLGEIAETAGAIRIDRPMMQQAAQASGPILLVYALASTADTSRALLQAALDAVENPAEIRTLDLGEFWPLFEAAEHTAFAACIAGAVRAYVAQNDTRCVVLAQASMATAARNLSDLGIPVLTSPESALRAVIGTVSE